MLNYARKNIMAASILDVYLRGELEYEPRL